MQFLVDILHLESGSVNRHKFAETDPWSQNLADPAAPDPKHCMSGMSSSQRCLFRLEESTIENNQFSKKGTWISFFLYFMRQLSIYSQLITGLIHWNLNGGSSSLQPRLKVWQRLFYYRSFLGIDLALGNPVFDLMFGLKNFYVLIPILIHV